MYIHWVPESQTINQNYCLYVFAKLHEKIRKKRPEMWKDKAWLFHQDDASAHSIFSI